MEEVSFPRGGNTLKRKISDTQPKYHVKNLFSFTINNKKKSKKRRKALEDEPLKQEDLQLTSTKAEVLSSKVLEEGILILGYVCQVTPYSVEVELPGKMFGKIKINSISQIYTSLLQKTAKQEDAEIADIPLLSNLVKVGEFVPTKLLRKTTQPLQLELSMNPFDINSDLNHSLFTKGFMIWASISSELDHGYQLDAGVANCRIFLPQSNVAEGQSLVIGQNLWCIVMKSSVTNAASIVTVSILKEHLQKPVMNDKLSLHALVPGMPLNFYVTKSVEHGLQGTFLNNYTGYVNEGYFKTPLDSVSKYGKGKVIQAWLMYIQPTTKLSYFTLRNSELTTSLKYDIGYTVQVQVHSYVGSGLLVKCPNKEICYIPNKRLNLPKSNALSKAAILNKYPNNSTHRCRILNYHRLDQVYIGSFEPSILNEKYFTSKDIKIGDCVEAEIKIIVKDGLVVKFGQINGFIHNNHLSNVTYSENMKKQFRVRQKLKTKVWNIDERTVNLTYKSALVNSNLCLSKYDRAYVGKEYPGVVTKVTKNVVVVAFYGGVNGILFKNSFGTENSIDLANMFYMGEVIKTIIKTVTPDKIYLRLNKPVGTSGNCNDIALGECVSGTIIAIKENGLQVEVGSDKIKAFVPASHISNSFLSSVLSETYKVGDVLEELLCIAKEKKQPVLSITEAIVYKARDFEIPSIEKLEVGAIIRGYYKSSDATGVKISIVNSYTKLKINYSELFDTLEQKNFFKFEPYQVILTKIKQLNVDKKKLFICARLSSVFSGDYTLSLQFLEQYMLDFQRIHSHHLSIGSSLGELKLGQRVKCVVDQINEHGCSVTFENGARGLVVVDHCPEDLKSGQKLTGVILWINFKLKFAEVSLLDEVINIVNEQQDGTMKKGIGSTSSALVLVSNPEYTVAVLKDDSANQQLIFLSTFIHGNAFLSRVQHDLEEIKVIITKKVGNMSIGIDRALKRFYIKQVLESGIRKKRSAKILKKKAKRARKDSLNSLNNDIEIKKEEGDSDDEVDEIQMNETNDDIEIKEEDDSDYDDITTNNEDDEPKVNEDVEDDVQKNKTKSNKKSKTDLKAKAISQNKDLKMDEDVDELQENKTKQTKVKKQNKSAENKERVKPAVQPTIALPGVQSFFGVDSSEPVLQSSDDDDNIEETTNENQKKKLTQAERKKLILSKEEELIRKENENADSTLEPQTAEQFEKVIKSNPNSSKFWAKYIAHLVFNGEIEKAKSIGQEALRTIALHFIKERYNIWMVILNLENSYGDKNSFEETFEEAVKRNDDLSIYLDTINILCTAQKFDEMEAKIQKAKKKFKQHERMWTEIAQVYYKLKKFNIARNMRDGAMKSIDKKLYIATVVKFAILEFQYGEKEQGEALFENILHLHPKRVDIWSTYIDQCIKVNNLDIARRILNRAVSQNIPPKKMKVLFTKFKTFETMYGDEEALKNVMELAENYVKKST